MYTYLLYGQPRWRHVYSPAAYRRMVLGRTQISTAESTIWNVVITKKNYVKIDEKLMRKLQKPLFDFARRLAGCGKLKKGPRPYKPWQVFVLTNTGRLLCAGTIISSNLLLITHECVQQDSKPYKIYDWFSPFATSHNLYNPDEYRIVKDPHLRLSYFKIVNIIFNFQHGINVATLSHEDNQNALLIQVTPPFTLDPELAPVCIPQVSELTDGLRGKEVYYFGLLTEDENSETLKYLDTGVRPWSKTKTTLSFINDNHTTTTTSAWKNYLKLKNQTSEPKNYLGTIYGQVVQEKIAEERSLPTMMRKEKRVPKPGGGAIFHRSITRLNDHRTFIVGTAASASASSKQAINFNNIAGVEQFSDIFLINMTKFYRCYFLFRTY